MERRTRERIAVAGVALVVVVASATFVVPNYRKARAYDIENDSLEQKITSLANSEALVASLQQRVDDLEHTIGVDLRSVGSSPDIADVINRLSLDVDGTEVRDQTFEASTTRQLETGTDIDLAALPVTIEMESDFDRIFNVIRAVELDRRLIPVMSVRIACDPETLEAGEHLPTASIGVEVVFAPPPQEDE
jgi:Tfp pilus assembly protein PilO